MIIHFVFVKGHCVSMSISKRKYIYVLIYKCNIAEQSAEGNVMLVIKVKVKLVTIVKGDSKAPFSIATTPRCRGKHKTFPCIAPLYPWYIPYNAVS